MMARLMRPFIYLLLAALVLGIVLGPVGSSMFGWTPFVPLPHVEVAPPVIFKIGSFKVTDTLLSSWLTTVVVLLLFIGGTNKMKIVPGRFQGFLEVFIEWLYNFVEGVVGPKFAKPFFPLLATIFIFVAFNAWMSLLPFYPLIGFKAPGSEHITTLLFRSAGTDINMPLSLALISFVFTEAWGFKVQKLGYFTEFFKFGALFRGIIHFKPGEIFMGAIDAFVGILELISHLIRILSFSFRLFGNMLAGEIVLFMVTFLMIFTAPLAFYLLEMLVGGVQALVFMGLTLVFTLLAVSPHGAHDEEHAEAGAH